MWLEEKLKKMVMGGTNSDKDRKPTTSLENLLYFSGLPDLIDRESPG